MPADQRVVTFEGKTQVFPADATDAEISAALNAIPAANSAEVPKAKTWTDWAVDKLPLAGAVVGGIVGASGGPVGAALGAGVGGAGGEAWKQNINRLRGVETPSSPTDAALAIGREGAIDAVMAGATGLVGKGVRVAAPTLERGGMAVASAADSPIVKKGARILAGWFGLHGALGEGFGSLVIPEAVETAGNTVAAGARLVQRIGSKGGTAALSTSERAAQIPVRERLAQIPLQDVTEAWQAAKAAAPSSSLADDVLMVRALKATGFSTDAAVKIASGGKADYAEDVMKGWTASLKAKGAPIPEAALKASGKVAPAITELMQSPTFRALASHVKDRAP